MGGGFGVGIGIGAGVGIGVGAGAGGGTGFGSGGIEMGVGLGFECVGTGVGTVALTRTAGDEGWLMPSAFEPARSIATLPTEAVPMDGLLPEDVPIAGGVVLFTAGTFPPVPPG